MERSLILLLANNNYYLDKKKTNLDKTNPSLNLGNFDHKLENIKSNLIPKSFLIIAENFNKENNNLSNKILSKDCQYLLKNYYVDYYIDADELRHEKIIMMNLYEKYEIFKEDASPAEEKFIKILISIHNDKIEKINLQ